MPTASFGELFTKIKHCAVGENFTKLRKAAYFKNGQFHKVWSGASVVSYYDGATLIGTVEVDEGNDVLHPDLSLAKENYTLCGWSISAEYLTKVESLVATGEPMSVYAIYLPNSLNVLGNSRYVSGSTYTSHAETPAYTGGASLDSIVSFTLNMHEYQNNTVTVTVQNLYSGSIDNDQPWGYGMLDSYEIPKNSSRSYTNIANGTHIVRTVGHTANESEARNTQELRCYVSSLVLSNPIPWT